MFRGFMIVNNSCDHGSIYDRGCDISYDIDSIIYR